MINPFITSFFRLVRLFTLSGLILLLLITCSPATVAELGGQFASIPAKKPVLPGQIDEASGLTASQTIGRHLWVNEDSDTPAQINLLSPEGALIGRLALPGIRNRDWEDITCGPGPQAGLSYLYLADIGDNTGSNDVNFVYRLIEPTDLNTPISVPETIAFRYTDGGRDAEALLVDPRTRDIWIISKEAAGARLYQLPYPQSTTTVNKAQYRGELPLSYVTSASISPDGQEILVKNYLGVYYWQRNSGSDIGQALTTTFSKNLTYLIEPQGEAICFEQRGRGFYTISERASAASVTLNYYSRQ